MPAYDLGSFSVVRNYASDVKVETGKGPVAPEVAAKIADALGVSPADLLED